MIKQDLLKLKQDFIQTKNFFECFPDFDPNFDYNFVYKILRIFVAKNKLNPKITSISCCCRYMNYNTKLQFINCLIDCYDLIYFI